MAKKETKQQATTTAATTTEQTKQVTPKEPRAPFARKIGYREPTKRTEEQYGFETTPPKAPSPKKRRSSWFIRDFTFRLTGRHTVHAQENARAIAQFLNAKYKLEGRLTLDVSVSLGGLNMWNAYEKRRWDFQTSAPKMDAFIKDVEQMTSLAIEKTKLSAEQKNSTPN